jgi:hypothetical protein
MLLLPSQQSIAMKMNILVIIWYMADDNIYIVDAMKQFFQDLLPFDDYFFLSKVFFTLNAQNCCS